MAYVKYLLLLSLLVLGLTLLSGAAFAADSWVVVGQDVPSALEWDGSASASVDANNDGTTTWDTTYGLASTDATPVVIDRWGVPAVQVVGTVAPAAENIFDFTVTAPPISTVAYPLPVGVSPGVIAGFDNDYVVFNGSGLINTDIAANTTKITRFNDTNSGDAAHVNFAFYIEELAGKVPAITTGFADGGFHPVDFVTRGQMGAFLQRSLQLPLLPYAGTFSDVASDYFAAQAIEACVTAGIATGFSDGTFRPLTNVKRNQMAVFLARGLVGGEAFVPSFLASDQSFNDVTVSDFGFNHIEFCFENGITTGFADGGFHPANNVTRGQMAAFLYRAFIEPTDSVVVLAGPAVTEVDITAIDYDGWTSSDLVPPSAPGTAYVGFDAVRLGDAQVVTVSFSIMDGTTEIATSGDLTLDASTVKPAALASGVPYAYVKWAIPTGLPVGVYTLETTVDGVLLAREPGLSIGTLTTIFAEGFEGGAAPAGWTLAAADPATAFVVTSIAAGDQWEMGCAPDNHVGAPTGNPRGSFMLASNPAGDNGNWPGYGDTDSHVTTVAIDCSALAAAPKLHWTGAVATNTGSGSNSSVEYSVDGGTTWTELDSDMWCACCDGGGWASTDGWIDFTYDIPGAEGKSNVLVRWNYVGTGCCWGWIIDNVSVDGLQ